ncbi:hypothetical protein F5884DRAFT_376073 [Xylogone sp. PMI_703]|nr:hypothetical protein F5884DRAFT_376073 [Xylogone sp. PMI_703]
MQPLIAAMIKLRKALYAAFSRSLMRTKSLLQTILNIWISPVILRSKKNGRRASNLRKSVKEFLEEVERIFRGPTDPLLLAALSEGMKKQVEECMEDNQLCMLPSYNSELPTGHESGTFLALDVGGSTFRLALIQLSGGKDGEQESKILGQGSFKIGNSVRKLEGIAFFEWMAERIEEVLSGQLAGYGTAESPLQMGLAWSFPIEQTSLRSGRIQGMGKGFLAAQGLSGQDLGDILQAACSKKGLHLELLAIVNDSSACLLSKAYHDPSTRFGLILGTGVNAAVHLPTHLFSSAKFGERPQNWFDSATHVIVNTELSMFGNGILPLTKFDQDVLSRHPNPTFQPLEHLVGGGYLGEITRLVLIEGIQTAGLFGGVVPPSLKEPYSLDTQTISLIEADTSSSLKTAISVFTSAHPSNPSPTKSDIKALRTIASHVSYRASAMIAAGVYALWQLSSEGESTAASPIPLKLNTVNLNTSINANIHAPGTLTPESDSDGDVDKSTKSIVVTATTSLPDVTTPPPALGDDIISFAHSHATGKKTLVAYNGSVLENYPQFRANCQKHLDELVEAAGGERGTLELEPAVESSLLGAAVAAAVAHV